MDNVTSLNGILVDIPPQLFGLQNPLACHVLQLEGWHWFCLDGVCKPGGFPAEFPPWEPVTCLQLRFPALRRTCLICCEGPSHKVSTEFRLELCRLHPQCVSPLLAPAGAEDERQLLLLGGTTQGENVLLKFPQQAKYEKINTSIIMKKAFDIQWVKPGCLSLTQPVPQACLMSLIFVTPPFHCFSAHLQTPQRSAQISFSALLLLLCSYSPAALSVQHNIKSQTH